MKPFPWKCASCAQRAVGPETLATYTATLEHDGRSHEVGIRDLAAYRCGNCGDIVFDDAAEERLYDALREKVGLLAPAEIRARREGLGLTQKQMAAALRLSESTISRWETGGQIQQRAMDLLLRAFFDLPALRSYILAADVSVAGPDPRHGPLSMPLFEQPSAPLS